MVVFALLALSTVLWTDMPARFYLAFLLMMVFFAALAAGLAQNALFAFVSSFGPIYAQAIMTLVSPKRIIIQAMLT